EAQEIAALDYHQLAVSHRDRVGSPRMAIEQRDLAEHFARLQQVERRLAAADRRYSDLHRSSADREQRRARIAFGEDGGAPRHSAQMRVGCELLKLCRFELTEYWMHTQERCTLGNRAVRCDYFRA